METQEVQLELKHVQVTREPLLSSSFILPYGGIKLNWIMRLLFHSSLFSRKRRLASPSMTCSLSGFLGPIVDTLIGVGELRDPLVPERIAQSAYL